jgi:hypothetical protein
MKRTVVAAVAASFVALAVGACGDDARSTVSAGPGGGPSFGPGCHAQTTCGACTPIVGCGWCFTATGGSCHDNPDECTGNEFSWTWEPSGCPGVDASVAPPVDAGQTEASAEAGVDVEIVETSTPGDAAGEAGDSATHD